MPDERSWYNTQLQIESGQHVLTVKLGKGVTVCPQELRARLSEIMDMLDGQPVHMLTYTHRRQDFARYDAIVRPMTPDEIRLAAGFPTATGSGSYPLDV